MDPQSNSVIHVENATYELTNKVWRKAEPFPHTDERFPNQNWKLVDIPTQNLLDRLKAEQELCDRIVPVIQAVQLLFNSHINSQAVDAWLNDYKYQKANRVPW